MGTLGTRLRTARLAAGKTQQQAADVIGTSRNNVGMYEKDEHAPPAEALRKLAGFYGVSVDHLLTGAPANHSTETHRHVAQQAYVVVRGIAQTRRGGYFTLMNSPEHVTPARTVPWSGHFPDAYALQVQGDGFRPFAEPGQFIIVEPSMHLDAGRRVLVTLKDGTRLVRVLSWRRADQIELRGLADDVEPLTVDAGTVESIERVTGVLDDDAAREA